MKSTFGDLIDLAKKGNFDVIAHGCNCFCTMGAGIARQIKREFPEAYRKDMETEIGDRLKIGTISYVSIQINNRELIVVNGYTQFNWKGKGRKVDYDAIRKVFQEIKKKFSGHRIGYPAIGAGLAGGDWSVISTIIDEELENEDHTLVIYQKQE